MTSLFFPLTTRDKYCRGEQATGPTFPLLRAIPKMLPDLKVPYLSISIYSNWNPKPVFFI